MIADSIAVSPLFDALDCKTNVQPSYSLFRPIEHQHHAGAPAAPSPASFHSEDSILASLDAIESRDAPSPKTGRPSPSSFVQIVFDQAQRLQSASATLFHAIDGLLKLPSSPTTCPKRARPCSLSPTSPDAPHFNMSLASIAQPVHAHKWLATPTRTDPGLPASPTHGLFRSRIGHV